MTADHAALQRHAETEQRRLDHAIVVCDAESVVAVARTADLTAAHRAARRHLAAARGVLTRARKHGDAALIASAARRLSAAQTEFERVSDAVIAETSALNRAQLDQLADILDQMRTCWDAQAAAVHALHDPPHRP